MSATLTPTVGAHYAIGDAVVQVLDVFENREDHGGPVEILVRANTEADGLRLGWGKAGTTYGAVFNVDDFLRYAEPIDAAPKNTSTGAVTDHAPAPVGAPTPEPFDLGDFVDAVTGAPAAEALADSPEPFSVEGMRIVSGWLVEPVNECTCGGADQYGHAAHEPGCGIEPVARLDDLPGWPGELGARPSTTDAVAAIKKRLSWASIHWGTKGVHEDAWAHIADAVLNLWDAEANR